MGELIGLIIALIIIGVVAWAARQLIGLIPMEGWIAQVINVLIIVVLVLGIVFYVLVPLLGMVGGQVGRLPSIR